MATKNLTLDTSNGEVSGVDAPAVVDELTDLDTTVTGAQLNALKTKVDGVEALADVTDATNVAAAGGVMDTRTVGSGTGLTGGGDLSADRTLAVTYGTGAGTACQGNDSRLSDDRDPTAHTHGAADVNSGTLGIARIPTGATSSTVCIGNDSRLSDQRTPSDNSVTSAKIVAGAIVNSDVNASAAIDVSKLGTGHVAGEDDGTATTLTLWKGTQAQYDAIGTPDSDTVYVVT